mmetsp:Transcript_26348/g.53991  ORF Transcript_26348/g.53991 Transcript_26348/m.53991 type:complete len:440 (-) Transcript_26348:57-1376(-)|eukprot:CAMPEP_0183325708 /NCGR_PEP_ID=MMETSP0160_2-20130417/80230_1 /TAXON_ID=2839 ORGANISM="Odontella Sinensis, Strain Grunow 1884" /NCGR_SAMPLE_ID=MMETSP0160_2 /ASSEMBLY_ACC=CAM_ASM_000250 /LENGTH=439 /DNA_ID=CAMNT_0025493535 /DNA_START=189 /DNA_END=1508 /DNA_ORIENTATION=-
MGLEEEHFHSSESASISANERAADSFGAGGVEDEKAALLRRLGNQFGDMDLSNLLDAKQETINAESGEESEESSVVEPTPEELYAWQQAQFKLGKWAQEEKKKKRMTEAERVAEALQRRRQERKMGVADSDDWEEVHPQPSLNEESVFFPSFSPDGAELVGAHPLLVQLASNDPEMMGGEWRRLYSSATGDGLSFHHLLSALRGYDGPTVLIVGTVPSAAHVLNSGGKQNAGTLGIFTTTPWIESDEFFGTDDCFLFSIHLEENEVKTIRPTAAASKSKRSNYMYCYPSSLTAKNRRSHNAGDNTDGAVYGIGMGGKPSQPRLHLTETLEECRALAFDTTFEDGALLPGDGAESLYYFDVDALEVWGVGGEGWIQGALKAREAERKKTEAALQKARTVDKSQFVEDFRSGLLDGGRALFGHSEQIAGRADSYQDGCHPP